MVAAFYRIHGDTIWRPLCVTAEPTVVETDPGGMAEATVPCALSRALKRSLEGADLRIDGMGRPFFGRIDDVAENVHAWGHQVWTDDKMREAVYYEDSLDGWKVDTPPNLSLPETTIELRTDSDGTLRAIFPVHTWEGGNWNGWMLKFATAVAHGHISCPYTLPRNDFHLQVWASATGATWAQLVDTNDPSGTVEQDFAGILYLALIAEKATVDSISGPLDCTFKPVIYAVENAGHTAHVSDITPYGILKDSADKLSTDVLPAGEAYRAFLSADATELGRMVFPPTTREREIVAEVCKRVDMRYGWWSRIVAGEYVPVPVSEPHETTASYYAAVGRDVKASLNPRAFKDKARITRLGYRAADGTSIYEDVTDADITHSPAQLGIDRYDTIYVNTSSAALARTVAASHQAETNKDSAPGTVEITGRILDNGRLIMPCDIEAGKLITLDRTEYGAVTDRITSVEKVGRSLARLTLAGAPVPVTTAIRRLLGAA